MVLPDRIGVSACPQAKRVIVPPLGNSVKRLLKTATQA
jgi:ABC-type amino acid transport system permease subunit